MRAPDFWRKPDSLIAGLLSPLGSLYGTITSNRAVSDKGYRPSIPVICIGNVVLGGAGKTPVTRYFAEHERFAGKSVHILSRGYGGRESGPVRVDPEKHGAEDVGDEPLLLARSAPVWIARDRAAGCRAIEAAGADFILMDDGFQNPSVMKTRSLIVIDAAYGLGNGRAFPAGPLREPLEKAATRADAIILVGDGNPDLGGCRLPLFRTRLVPANGHLFRGRAVHAFSGIGRPEKFYRSLSEAGASIRKRTSFPDHHPFTAKELARLQREAEQDQARLVTTEKDHVRLPHSFRDHVDMLTVRLEWENNSALLDMIEQADVRTE